MITTVLIVEDDDGLRSSIVKSCGRRGYTVLDVSTISQADELLRRQKINFVLLDIRLPDGSGLELLQRIRLIDPDIIVVMMTAFPELKTAVQAMKAGAYDFIIKPFELEELHLAFDRASETHELRRDVRRLERERRTRDYTGGILGESEAIEKLHTQIRLVAESDIPLLISGETGTGKELVANSVHRLSARSKKPMITANCSAFPAHLLESELFGHEKGAFTDAHASQPGLFEMCSGGSLFLDEVADMELATQAKLLRVIEGHSFRRVGGRREIRVDVRVIAATNRDLPSRIRAGMFRDDLYYRLNAFQIEVPPLRVRGMDTILLARHFLERSSETQGKGPLTLSSSAEEMLSSYRWPGNIRELRNVMERATILCETSSVGVEHLPGELRAAPFVPLEGTSDSDQPLTLDEIERRHIRYVLESTGGNLAKTAKTLGIARNTLKAKLIKWESADG